MDRKSSHKRLKIVFAIAGILIAVMITACGASDMATDTSGEITESGGSETEIVTDSDTDSETSGSEDTAAAEDTDDAEAITEDEAQDIAVTDSGLSGSEIKYINIWTEKEDGQWLYAVEFGTYDDTEYKYEIDMYTGEIAASYIESH